VNDLDVAPGTVTIRRTLAAADEDGQGLCSGTKTITSSRTISLDPEVMQVRVDYVRQRPVPSPHGLMLTREDGSPLRHNWGNRKFAWFAEPCPGVRSDGRLHGLRHAFVTLAIGTGAPLSKVSQMAGHSSIRIADDRCGHSVDRYRARAASMSPPSSGTPPASLENRHIPKTPGECVLQGLRCGDGRFESPSPGTPIGRNP